MKALRRLHIWLYLSESLSVAYGTFLKSRAGSFKNFVDGYKTFFEILD